MRYKYDTERYNTACNEGFGMACNNKDKTVFVGFDTIEIFIILYFSQDQAEDKVLLIGWAGIIFNIFSHKISLNPTPPTPNLESFFHSLLKETQY